jgi:hypothetical protein
LNSTRSSSRNSHRASPCPSARNSACSCRCNGAYSSPCNRSTNSRRSCSCNSTTPQPLLQSSLPLLPVESLLLWQQHVRHALFASRKSRDPLLATRNPWLVTCQLQTGNW